MKRRYVVFLFFILFEITGIKVQAQNDFCAPGKFAYTRLYSGDVLTVRCDTAYLFNKATFGLYKRLYQNFGTPDQKMNALLSSYDYMKSIYENRIAGMDTEYQQLQSRFDSLSSTSQNFIRLASSDLTEVKKSITLASNSIVEAQNNLMTAEEQLKIGIRGSRKKMIQWGLGGFSIGAVSTAFLLTLF